MVLALGSLQDHVKIICYYSPKRAKYTNEGCQPIKHNTKIETALKGRNILISAHEEKRLYEQTITSIIKITRLYVHLYQYRWIQLQGYLVSPASASFHRL